MAKWLFSLGLALMVLGLLWPLFSRIGLGHLPGDIRIERPGMVFYFPITTSILLSLLVTLVLWLFRR